MPVAYGIRNIEALRDGPRKIAADLFIGLPDQRHNAFPCVSP
jgi:hypothetical protein